MTLEQTWRVYALLCGDGSLYLGITTDLERRLRQHQTGRASRYTRSRLPVTLLGSTPVSDKGEALRLEYRLKQLPREEKLRVITGWEDNG